MRKYHGVDVEESKEAKHGHPVACTKSEHVVSSFSFLVKVLFQLQNAFWHFLELEHE